MSVTVLTTSSSKVSWSCCKIILKGEKVIFASVSGASHRFLSYKTFSRWLQMTRYPVQVQYKYCTWNMSLSFGWWWWTWTVHSVYLLLLSSEGEYLLCCILLWHPLEMWRRVSLHHILIFEHEVTKCSSIPDWEEWQSLASWSEREVKVDSFPPPVFIFTCNFNRSSVSGKSKEEIEFPSTFIKLKYYLSSRSTSRPFSSDRVMRDGEGGGEGCREREE